jgi:hypothetical protein
MARHGNQEIEKRRGKKKKANRQQTRWNSGTRATQKEWSYCDEPEKTKEAYFSL